MNNNLVIKHKGLISRQTIIGCIAATFILLFTYTAFIKLLDLGTFRWVLSKSPLLKPIAAFIAISIPVIELLIVLLLFVPSARIAGLYGAFLLMLLFTVYIAYMLLFTPHLPCSCGGVLKHMGWKQHLLFNFLFTVLAAAAIHLQKKSILLYNKTA